MRSWRLFVLLFCVFALVVPDIADAARGRARRYAPRPSGVNDPRYAALIMNPKTGEVYHSRAADTKRYPASLTKMMTLYLLFEALEQKKVSMSTKLRVSDYASVQPQTNISLTTMDTIPVETAIKALVVRSANDVAVVVAENLGGSVPNFGKRMTEKARQLGMRNTVFRNPHGLPDSGQYTTAHDMAKLGIALKRDFPRYYQYFSTRQFSWKGVTYYTHNRVMLRYAGTDGIKTGFINASGFNVVTSTERGGRPLIGVVMGGTTGGWRDDRMIQLLDAAYATIAKRGNATGRMKVANLPLVNGRQVEVAKPVAAPQVIAVQVAPVAADRGVIAQAEPAKAAEPVRIIAPAQAPIVSAPPAVVQQPPVQIPAVITPPPQVVAPPSVVERPPAGVIAMAAPRAVPAPNTLDAQMAALQNRQQVRDDAGMGDLWGIQVGAFSSRQLAERAALQAYQLAQRNLQGSRITVLGSGGAGAEVHRARLENITQNQAKKACEMLISNNSPCFIFRAGSSL